MDSFCECDLPGRAGAAHRVVSLVYAVGAGVGAPKISVDEKATSFFLGKLEVDRASERVRTEVGRQRFAGCGFAATGGAGRLKR